MAAGARAAIDAIDAILPQTQCTKCGFGGCRPYAEAIAAATAPINRCPPGGEAGIRALAALTGADFEPLDPACGREQPLRVAFIEESRCIGCTLCIQACPLDAIVGAAKLMHTVVPQLCSGCDLCVPPCPVDCIVMRPAVEPWTLSQRAAARERHHARNARLAREQAAANERLAAPLDKRGMVEAAIARSRARRAAR